MAYEVSTSMVISNLLDMPSVSWAAREQCSKMLIENYSGKRVQWTIAMEAAAAGVPLRRSICSPTAK